LFTKRITTCSIFHWELVRLTGRSFTVSGLNAWNILSGNLCHF